MDLESRHHTCVLEVREGSRENTSLLSARLTLSSSPSHFPGRSHFTALVLVPDPPTQPEDVNSYFTRVMRGLLKKITTVIKS